jgi:hypothetical protein
MESSDEESTPINPPKRWEKVKVYNTYQEAHLHKEGILHEFEATGGLVKIRRCGEGGTQFKVKFWHPDFAPPKKNKNKKKNT